MNDHNNPSELLRDFYAELSGALRSLSNREGAEPIATYFFHVSEQVARWIDGFLHLRLAGKIDSSRLMVRPCIESALRIQAIRRKPELFYRVAFSEFDEDLKFLRAAPVKIGHEALPEIEKQWLDFEKRYRLRYPNHVVERRVIKAFELAEAAQLIDFYNSDYRLFCRFTHAALRAATGGLDFTEGEDFKVISLCALVCLDCLANFGAAASNLKTLKVRLYETSSRSA